ncbi:hypothetical protein BsWGS_22934 [Bradybaena similaris]
MPDADVPATPAVATPKAVKKKAASSKPKGPFAHPQYKVVVSVAINALNAQLVLPAKPF